MKIYYESDANLEILQGKRIAILGYGSQGHAHALNLKESGVDVVVGLRKDSSSVAKAQSEGLRVLSVREASQEGDIIMVLLPDEEQRAVYESEIKDGLKSGNSLFFAHGFNIHFQQIEPDPTINVCMVAPKGPGHTVRREFVEGAGVPSLVAIHQDATGNSKELALAYAKGIGGTRAGVFETSFKEETETDLFGEQAVLCGGVSALISAGFETLVKAGYAPEMAFFECMHEMKLIVDLIYEGGLSNMRYSISNTAEYGDFTRGHRIINDRTKQEMKKILAEIQTGKFAKEWILENQANQSHLKAMRRQSQEKLIESVGKTLRNMMPWLKKNQLVDSKKN